MPYRENGDKSPRVGNGRRTAQLADPNSRWGYARYLFAGVNVDDLGFPGAVTPLPSSSANMHHLATNKPHTYVRPGAWCDVGVVKR